jgi:hypothetical protein
LEPLAVEHDKKVVVLAIGIGMLRQHELKLKRIIIKILEIEK